MYHLGVPNEREADGRGRRTGVPFPSPGGVGRELSATARMAEAELEPAGTALPGERRVLAAAHRSLAGDTRGLRALLPFLGPAFVAAVAYVDPGNFATNIASGARYGYMLLWVVLAANLMAMLIQSMSAKLGIATGMNLPEVCRARFPRPVSIMLWIQAELIAMATDLAEFIGAAVGLNLLFHIPLLAAGFLTGLAAFGILALQARGFRQLEAVIAGLVGVIVAAFAFEVFLAKPSVPDLASGLLIPRFDGSGSVLLAAGILGATVMPHVIYLHSALTQQRVVGRDAVERQRIFRFERWDVIIAMAIAGAINMAMLITAAATFYARGISGVEDLDNASRALGQVLGSHADLFFGLGLLASGLSSSSVGTLAGQVVMQGFIRRRIPVFLRRAITMAPALVVIALGVGASSALILSQVVLSFGIPFALIPLLLFCRNRGLMGELVNRRLTTITATAVVGVIVLLNVVLLAQLSFGG
jgi:manganese transport protein